MGKGMEAKVRAFKDNERKKHWAWQQSRMTQDLKRAKIEQAYLAGQTEWLKQKTKLSEAEKMKRLKPWERKRMQEEQEKRERDMSEEQDMVRETELEKKEGR